MPQAIVAVVAGEIDLGAQLDAFAAQERLLHLRYRTYYELASQAQPQAEIPVRQALAHTKLDEAIDQALGAGVDVLVACPFVGELRLKSVAQRCRLRASPVVLLEFACADPGRLAREGVTSALANKWWGYTQDVLGACRREFAYVRTMRLDDDAMLGFRDIG